MKRVVN